MAFCTGYLRGLSFVGDYAVMGSSLQRENRTFQGPEEYLRTRGVAITVVDDERCIALMQRFIEARPDLWHEDIGV